MPDFRLLSALAAVLDHGGFERAARHLCITQSAVSQRIRLLEQHIGQPLLIRSTPPHPTEQGWRLLRHFRQIAHLENELAAELAQQQHNATLALGVNADSLATWFLPTLLPFLQQHGILVDLVHDNEDYTHELMRQGRVIACVSTRANAMQGTHCRALGVMRYCCVATPAFVARYFPHGVTAEALAHAPATAYNRKDDLHAHFLAQHFAYHGSYPTLTLPLPEGFVSVARAGIAYALVPDCMVEDALACGELVSPCPAHYAEVPLYWHCWHLDSALLRALSTALAHGAATYLHPI